MNKFIIALMLSAAVMWSCGGNGSAKKSNNEAVASSCGHDHSHDSHEGHDHSKEGHNHAAEKQHDHSTCEGDHDHGEAETDFSDEIVFPAAQAARIDFEVRKVEPSSFTEVIKATGIITAAQGDEISIIAPVGGVVSFAGPGLSEGTAVSAGRPMLYISSKNIASGDAIAKVSSAYRKAKADMDRAAALRPDNLISEKDYQAAVMEYEQARTEYEALAASQSDKGTGVSSAAAGYVTSLYVREGDYVEMGQLLGSIAKNRRQMLRAEVPARYFDRLAGVRSANFTVPYNNKTYRLSDMRGRLMSVGKSSAADSFLVPVTFEFDSDGTVPTGTFVEVYLTGARMQDVITLPLSAITEQQGVNYVYVQLDEEGYRKQEVTLGAGDGQQVRILSGVRTGDRVVTKGAVHVKMAAASGSIPHGHSH